MNENIVEVNNLIKSYGKTEIIKGISFTINRGEICGLVGNNGEGKTTILRTVLGLMKQTSGQITWNMNKNYIGYMPQTCQFNDRMSVLKTIKFFCQLRGCDADEFIQLCNKFKLPTKKEVKILSPGQQKKLQLILAGIGEPEVYVLDEPTAGLDPGSTLEVLDMIREVNKKGNSIMISSHILQDLNDICTKVLVLRNGVLSSNNNLNDVICFRVGNIENEKFELLRNKYNLKIDREGNWIEVTEKKEKVPDITRNLVAEGIDIYEISFGNLKNKVLSIIDKKI